MPIKAIMYVNVVNIKQEVSSACYYHLCRLRQIRPRIRAEVTTQLVLALVMSSLDYCNAVLAAVAGVLQWTHEPLQRVQNAAACLVHLLDICDHVMPSLMVLHWLPMRRRIDCAWSCTEYTLADARRISKTSSVHPTAQQHILAYGRLPAASTCCHGYEPSLENVPSCMPYLLHGTHCHQTTRHSCCSQPCHVQETTQNALFLNSIFHLLVFILQTSVRL